MFDVSYIGSQAHHLLVMLAANPGNPALCASLSQPSEVMPGTQTCGPFGENGVYYPNQRRGRQRDACSLRQQLRHRCLLRRDGQLVLQFIANQPET